MSQLQAELGAMSCVDELVSQDNLLKDHLDIESKKALIAERLKRYYESISKAVSDDIIATAINNWFANRLRFKPVALPLLLQLYITRQRWQGKARAWLLSLGAGVAVVLLSMQLIQSWELASKKGLLNGYEETLVLIRAKVEHFPTIAAHSPYLALQADIQSVLATRFENEAEVTAQQIVAARSAIDSEFFGKVSSEAHRALSRAENTVDSLQLSIQDSQAFINAEAAFLMLLTSPANKLLVNKVPSAQTLVAEIESLLKSDLIDSSTLVRKVAALDSLMHQIKTVDAMKDEMANLSNINLDLRVDRATYAAALGLVELALAEYKLPADGDIKHLRYLHDLATTELTLRINRLGKAGVERNYDKTGAKQWYIVVTAIGAAEKPFAVFVSSAETNEADYQEVFAIQVTDQLAAKIKTDKLDDGTIQDDVIGTKPVGRLTFELRSGASAHYILRW